MPHQFEAEAPQIDASLAVSPPAAEDAVVKFAADSISPAPSSTPSRLGEHLASFPPIRGSARTLRRRFHCEQSSAAAHVVDTVLPSAPLGPV